MNSSKQLVESRLKEIPTVPGIYIMKDKLDQILYIGKSKNLKNRVRSYFRKGNDLSPRITLMVRQIYDIDFIATDNEAEALTLESNLIKKEKPYYNILLKDDKKYPYLCITWSEKYPRIYITRRRRMRNSADRYYGPYVDVNKLRETLNLVKKLFPLRQRLIPLYKDRTCLNYSINRCPGVCQELISSEKYTKIVKRVEMIFQGRTKELKILLVEKMIKSSKVQNFELAALYRDQISGIDTLTQKQKMIDPDSNISRDIIALARENNITSIQLFQMRAGKLVARIAYTSGVEETNNILIQKVIEEHYSCLDSVEIPGEILVQYNLPNINLIKDWINEISGRKVKIICPIRNKKSELVDLVYRNAKYELTRICDKQKNELHALEDLTDILGLSACPKRIEAYDISHIQGSDPVASQVVFVNGIPAKQHYRKYKIKYNKIMTGYSDDYASLAEVIDRRFSKWSRLKKEIGTLKNIKKDSSRLQLDGLNDWPDLVLIDGGKGQLSSVVKKLTELDLQEDLCVCSLAKKDELVYTPNNKKPLDTNKDQEGLILLRKLRDEAHRFAISFHRKQRGKRLRRSELSDIPGIGPRRIRILLSYFKSIEAIQMAGPNELAKVPGLGKKNADCIWSYFHPINK